MLTVLNTINEALLQSPAAGPGQQYQDCWSLLPAANHNSSSHAVVLALFQLVQPVSQRTRRSFRHLRAGPLSRAARSPARGPVGSSAVPADLLSGVRQRRAALTSAAVNSGLTV